MPSNELPALDLRFTSQVHRKKPRMKFTILSFFLTPLVLCAQIYATTIVTKKERIFGEIVSQDTQSVTVRTAAARDVKIPFEDVLQIFNDKGDLVWQSSLPTVEKKRAAPPAPLSERKPEFANRAIILDFYVGTALGGFYTEENRAIDSLGIYTQYSDGSQQAAKTSMLTLGGGINYQWFSSLRWSNLLTYAFRSTSQTVSSGDNEKYEKKSFANATMTNRHSLLFGKELHFYPGKEESSWDFIGQIGYEFGEYKPLAGYNELRGQFPVLPRYAIPASVFVHGPTARVGTGFTFRGTYWQFRLLGFYQITYSFAAEQIWNAVPKNTVLHDLYAGASLGYGW